MAMAFEVFDRKLVERWRMCDGPHVVASRFMETMMSSFPNVIGKRILLTPQQAAEALAISPRKLWGMTSSGEIPHVRLGRSVRYPIADLQRWIDRQKKGGIE